MQSAGPLCLFVVLSAGCATGSFAGDDVDLDAGPSSQALPDSAIAAQDDSSARVDAATIDAARADAAPSLDASNGGEGGHDAAANDAAPDAPVGCSATATSATLVTFDFTGQPGDEGSTPVKSAAAGVSASDFGRASALEAATGTGSINSSNWTYTSSASHYYAFTVTPAAGCTLAITALDVDAMASLSGPTVFSVGTSVDGFSHKTAAALTTGLSHVTITGASSSSPIEVRLFAYGATTPGGTFRVQNTLKVTGNLQ